MTDAQRLLRTARSVLLVDWPSSEVPRTLTEAGYAVIVQGGPAPTAYSRWYLVDGAVERRELDEPLTHVDLVYVHRPLDELAGIVQTALHLGAKTVWRQSGLAGAERRDPAGCWLPGPDAHEGRRLVESAGLDYVDDVYIVDVLRTLAPRRDG